jgi:hypothetical protein
LLEDSVEERMEKALAESDKVEAESKDAGAEDNKARTSAQFYNITESSSSHVLGINLTLTHVCLRMCPPPLHYL